LGIDTGSKYSKYIGDRMQVLETAAGDKVQVPDTAAGDR